MEEAMSADLASAPDSVAVRPSSAEVDVSASGAEEETTSGAEEETTSGAEERTLSVEEKTTPGAEANTQSEVRNETPTSFEEKEALSGVQRTSCDMEDGPMNAPSADPVTANFPEESKLQSQKSEVQEVQWSNFGAHGGFGSFSDFLSGSSPAQDVGTVALPEADFFSFSAPSTSGAGSNVTGQVENDVSFFDIDQSFLNGNKVTAEEPSHSSRVFPEPAAPVQVKSEELLPQVQAHGSQMSQWNTELEKDRWQNFQTQDQEQKAQSNELDHKQWNNAKSELLQQTQAITTNENIWQELAEYPGWQYNTLTGEWRVKETRDVCLGYSWDSSASHHVAQSLGGGNQVDHGQEGTIGTQTSGIEQFQQMDQSAEPFKKLTRQEGNARQTDATYNFLPEVTVAQQSVSKLQESNGEISSGQSNSGWEDQYPGWYYDYHAQEWKQYSQSSQPPPASGFAPVEQQSQLESVPAPSFEPNVTSSNGFSQGYNSTGWSEVKGQQTNATGPYVHSAFGADDGFAGISEADALPSGQTQFPETWAHSQSQQFNSSYAYDRSGQLSANGKTWPSDFVQGNLDAAYRVDQIYPYERSQFTTESPYNQYAAPQLPKYTSPPSYAMNSYGMQQFPQYTPQTPPKSLEEATRIPIGRAPHALVSFGFGGKLVITKLKDSLSLESSVVHQAVANGQSCVSGPVVVHSLSNLVAQSADSGKGDAGSLYFGALSRSIFSGPLVGGSVSTKDLYKWLEDRAANCQSDGLQFGNPDSVSMMWGLLKLACKHYGKLRSQPGSAGITSQDEDGAEAALAKLLTSGGDQSSWTMSSFHSTVCLQAMPSEHQLQVTATELKRLLVAGKRKEALKTALQGQLWGPALVLSRQLGEKHYADTVAEMAQRQFLPGSPLRTLNLLLAGQPAEVFSGINTPAAPVQQAMQFSSETGNAAESGLGSMLEEWQENLSIIAANRTSGDDRVISHLGDCLWKVKGEVAAAHICYLVADADFEAFSSNARLCLVGADHWNNPRTYVSPEAIQRTEVYEYSKVLGNPQFILVAFQPYKLVYASMLAEAGKTTEALRYCQAVLKTLKTASRAPEVETCRQAAVSLEERLKVSLGGSTVNLAPTKLVRGLLSALDRGISGIIGGPPLPPAQEEFQAGASVESVPLQDHLSSARFGASPSRTQAPLGPSASAEKLKESGLTMPQRSVSEPDFSATMKEKAEQGKPNSRVGYLGRFGSVFSKAGGIVSLVSKTSKNEAKLGDKNTFYYDEKLKRWVEEGAETPQEEAALAPPPTAANFLSKAEESFSDAQFVLGAASTSGNKTGAFSGTPPVPPSNQFSARARPQGVRSRYVDTFNKGGTSTSSSKPAVSAFAPTLRGGGPMQQPMNFFVPGSSGGGSNGTVSNSNNGTSLGNGEAANHIGYFSEPPAHLQAAAQNENQQGGMMGTGVPLYPSPENNSAYTTRLMQGVPSSDQAAASGFLEGSGQTGKSPRNGNMGFSNGHHSRANSWSGYPSNFQTSVMETSSSSHDNNSANFSMYNGFSSQSTAVNAPATVGSYFPSIPKVDIYNPENDSRLRETFTPPLPSVSTSMPSATEGDLRPVPAEAVAVGKQADVSVVGDDLQEVEL